MNIHYKIVELWPDDHLIVARYWTDNITEEMLASDANRKEDGTPVRCRSDVSINLPVPMPTDPDEIDKLIKTAGPVEWLKILEDVKNPDVDTSLTAVVGLVGVTKSTNKQEIEEIKSAILESAKIPQIETVKELTDDDIQKLIDAVAAKPN
jgi:hypothetical protein